MNLHFSVNKQLINKPDRAALKLYSSAGWLPFVASKERLISEIQQGCAFAPQYKDQRRKGANFVCCGFLAADFDEGCTIDQARNNAFIHSHGSFIYTTVSHTSDHHRFRVVFLLDDPATDGKQWADANFGLAHKLSSDPSIGDAARCFYGSKSAQIWDIGQTLTKELFQELADYGAELRSARTNGYSVDSTRKIGADTLLRMASGIEVSIEHLPIGVSVHCPHHDDRNASAFTVQSWSGSVGIHCMTCRLTYWHREHEEYDFGAFDQMVERRQMGDAALTENPDGEGLAKFFPPDPSCIFHQDRYLPALSYRAGITMVKSPKGSGKTEALKALINQVATGNFQGGMSDADRAKSVLLIGHRRALLREAAQKLNLRFYLSADTDNRMDGLKTLAVCLDSLPEWNEPYVARRDGSRLLWKREKPYDLAIIDESEQVFSHLTGDTIAKSKGGISRHYDALEYEVANAKAVIALDADLGMLTAHALKSLRPQDWNSRCRIIYNKPPRPTQKQKLELFSQERALLNELMAAVQRGERCFVTCNSKKAAKVVHKAICQRFGDKVPTRLITSDNSRDPKEIEFVQNIKTEILKVQVLVCSPSLGTGIDITFPDGACRVDNVFGFFYPLINTHTDIDQQLARVRNPGKVKVWISPARFRFTSNFDVIRDDLARSYFVPAAVTGRSADGLVNYQRSHPLLMISTHITAAQRASKNRLIDLFCALREANGWEIEHVETKVSDTGVRKNAEAALFLQNADDLLSARSLDAQELLDYEERASRGDPLTPAERVELEKAKIEHALDLPLTYEIIKLNYDGKLLDRVALLASVVEGWKHLFETATRAIDEQEVRLDRLPAHSIPYLIMTIAASAGLSTPAGLDLGAKVEAARLAPFILLCEKNRTILEEKFGVQMRSDVKTNPVRQLNVFLKRLGLRLELDKRSKVLGTTVRIYSFSPGPAGTMASLASRFRDEDALWRVASEAKYLTA